MYVYTTSPVPNLELTLCQYAATASVEMCKFLIESGADVDEMGENTGTALSRIAGLDRHDTTLLLLENMADPTLSYPGWDNPLYTACSFDLVRTPKEGYLDGFANQS